jgi:protein tyrosine/serine phosphatase
MDSDSLGATRWLALEGAFNVRDLGGLPTARGVIKSGVLYRGDSLVDLTATDIAMLVGEHGLRTVIDLRSEFEQPGPADWMVQSGIAYRHMPLFDLSGEAAAGVRRNLADDVPAAYREMLVLAAPALVDIVRTMVADPDAGVPALVHCAAGKDRTGIVTAVLLSAVDVPDDLVVDDYLATGERLDVVRAALRRRYTYPPNSAPLPLFTAEPVEAVLDALRTDYGGAGAFLQRAGVPSDQIAALAGVLVASR